MIPLQNRTILIKRLKEGMDIRNACKVADITRSNLYKYFKEVPGFRDEVDMVQKIYLERKSKADMIAERRNLMKVKEIIRRRKG